jgi:dipeptidyl aminopeptidase/acylaminoacyl peptidase
MRNERFASFVVLLGAGMARAEIVEYSGSPAALQHDRYIHVVSERDSPIEQAYIKAKDGLYIAAAIRKPRGEGPFPAIVLFHGAPGGRGMEQITGWSRGDHGGPVWERFLQEGFAVIVADYRGGDFNLMNTPSKDGRVTAIDDGVAVIAHVRALPYVDSSRVSVYGVSLGGNLALFLASIIPDLHAVVVGAPAPMWFLGVSMPAAGGPRPDLGTLQPDPAVATANIAPIATPILMLVGTADPLLGIDRTLHEALASRGKQIRMEIYEHGYHDFVLGPQGHTRPDLPQGEILLQGALDALERTVQFVKKPR